MDEITVESLKCDNDGHFCAHKLDITSARSQTKRGDSKQVYGICSSVQQPRSQESASAKRKRTTKQFQGRPAPANSAKLVV